MRRPLYEARAANARAPHWAVLACFAGLLAGCASEPVIGSDNEAFVTGDTATPTMMGCQADCECSGEECVCPDDGHCEMECVSDCDLECTGSDHCFLGCEESCVATCAGEGDCSMSVGEGSTVSCIGSGDCMIGCNGACDVACEGSGACVVRCYNGTECSPEICARGATDCGDGTIVCGGDCLMPL